MSDITLVRNCRFAIAWDPSSAGHVYRTGIDVAFS